MSQKLIRETILLLLVLQSGSNSGMSTVDLKEAFNGTVYEAGEVEIDDYDDNDDDEVDVEMILVILVYGVTFLLGSIGNTLVIIGIAKFKKMHSVTNIFLVSLASADLLLIVTCIPFKVSCCTSLLRLILKNVNESIEYWKILISVLNDNNYCEYW